MSKRYFYTCPIVAALMAKYHGVSMYIGCFESDDFDSYSHRNLSHFIDDWQYKGVKSGEYPKFYIHPDSVHLLEPIVGDILTFVCDDGSIAVDAVEQIYEPNDECYPYVGNGIDSVIHLCASHPDWIHAPLAKIIQRNGLPFVMPESEEV